MASFTDDIIKFNPYISDIPTDDYIRSGMELQQRYDKGVSTVQSYISSIAGLPVSTEADKAYLSKKLGELRNRVQGVVGADYSQQSFVSQIGNIAGQIGSDPTIRAGVNSTASIQKLHSDKDYIMREKPEFYSEANWERALQSVNEYMEAGRTQSGLSYQGPTAITRGTGAQVRKKILEAAKQLDPDASVIIDPRGDVIIKSKHKDLQPEKIQTLIQATLDANDYTILGNEGWYNMRGFSDDQVKASASKFYTEQAKAYQGLSDSIKKTLSNTDALTDTQKTYYSQQKSIYDGYIERYTDQAKNINNAFGTELWDRDMVTSSYWVDNLTASMGQALQKHEYDVTFEVDPFVEALLKRSQIAKNLKDAKEESDGFAPSFLSNVPVNPDTQPPETVTKVIERDQKIDEALDSNFDATLKASLIDKNGQYTSDAQQYLDEDGKFLPGAREELAKRAVATFQGYHASATGKVPYDKEPLPNNNEATRRGLFNQRVLSQIKENIAYKDKVVEKRARAELGPGVKLDFNEKVNIGNKTLTIGDIYDAFYSGTKEITYTPKSTAPGFVPSQPVTLREKIEGGKLDSFLKEQGITEDQVRQTLSKRGFDLKTLDTKKDKVYKDYAAITQPYQISVGVSEKFRKSPQYDILEKAVRNSAGIIPPKVVGAQGEKIEYGDITIPADDKIDIQGGYYSPDGKNLYITATFSGKKEGDKDIRKFTGTFDVTELRKKSLGVDWFDTYFSSDNYPELTASLYDPANFNDAGVGKGTSFNEKAGFDGSLFITSRNDVGRYYQLLPSKSGGMPQIMVKVAIPLGNGLFEYRMVNHPNVKTEEFKFPNAGSAIQYMETMYGPSGNIIDREKGFIKSR